MTRTFSTDASEPAQVHLQALLDAVGDPAAYQRVMTSLGRDLGLVLANRLPADRPVVVICTVEDADSLAAGLLEAFTQTGRPEPSLACFWNHRRMIGEHRVAQITRRYIEPLPPRDGVIVVLKSIISGGCVVRTNLLEILGSMTELTPEDVFIAAPVMHRDAPLKLAAEFPAGWAERFQYVCFATDTVREADGTVRPGVGGSVYQNLGWSDQAEKNRAFPRIIDQRNARFLTPA